MAELIAIRHAQASFGADDYDKLSDLGHKQSVLVGEYLRGLGWRPDRLVTGTLTRQLETLSSMGVDGEPETHAGLNEYDFTDLLKARFPDGMPDDPVADRRAHFRLLRDTIFDWQAGKLTQAAETWPQFAARIEAGRAFATRPGAKRVLMISSGGPIGQMVAASMGAPAAQMMHLNLQVKNTAITRFVFTQDAFSLHEFNTTPHLDTPERAQFLTFS